MNQVVTGSNPHPDLTPTGRLRVALNMGNPVLTSSRLDPEGPAGVTIDLANELAARLGVEADFQQHATAADALKAVAGGTADIGFMAIDPGRAAGIHFTGAYLEIQGSYVVPIDSPLMQNEDVDAPGVTLVVGQASAYDLFLTRHIQHATLLRVPLSEQVIDDMVRGGHEAGAGVRQQLQAEMARFPTVRLLDGGFMTIRQACVIPADRSATSKALVTDFIEEARAGGFVEAALDRHGVEGAQIASKA